MKGGPFPRSDPPPGSELQNLMLRESAPPLADVEADTRLSESFSGALTVLASLPRLKTEFPKGKSRVACLICDIEWEIAVWVLVCVSWPELLTPL